MILVKISDKSSSNYGKIAQVTRELPDTYFVKFSDGRFREYGKDAVDVISDIDELSTIVDKKYVIKVVGRYLNPNYIEWTLSPFKSSECCVTESWIDEHCPELKQFAEEVQASFLLKKGI